MVGQEADRRDHDVLHALPLASPRKCSTMSGSSHGWLGGPLRLWYTSANPVRPSRFGHEPRGLAELGLVVGRGGQRPGQAVGP